MTVTASSYDIDINSSDMKWTLNGKVVQDSIGQKSYTFTADPSGNTSTVGLTATPATGSPITTSITVAPTVTDLLWQVTDSTVPPLYRGKALPTSESTIRYVAMPELNAANGSPIVPSNLVYTWQDNYTAQQDASGYGKTSFTMASSDLDTSEHIDVSVASRDGSVTSAASVDINPVKPEILWYVDDPTYGPRFENALSGDYDVSAANFALFAEPYYFSPGTPSSPNLAYSWQLNDSAIDTPTVPNVLVLQRDTSDSGAATVDLSLSNVTTMFQEAESTLTLHLQ